jgi:hypothetical protein
MCIRTVCKKNDRFHQPFEVWKPRDDQRINVYRSCLSRIIIVKTPGSLVKMLNIWCTNVYGITRWRDGRKIQISAIRNSFARRFRFTAIFEFGFPFLEHKIRLLSLSVDQTTRSVAAGRYRRPKAYRTRVNRRRARRYMVYFTDIDWGHREPAAYK